MTVAVMIKVGFILAGALIMIISFFVLALRKMTANLALTWEIIGVALILIGAVPAFSSWSGLISVGTAVIMLIIGVLVICIGYMLSIALSKLIIRSNELAMQISLNNQENEYLLNEVDGPIGKKDKGFIGKK